MRISGLMLALSLVAVACGDGGGKGTTTGSKDLKPGGTLKIAASGDVDYMDPGQIYYSFSNMLFRVMVRTLVNYPPIAGEAGNKLVADIATNTGTVSADGKTYTFVIKDGVKFQPETAGGRQVTSADIRYGIERGFYPSILNGYVNLYFKDLFVGDEAFIKDPKPGNHITGIDVSDPKKIVFKLKAATGDFLYRLALPVAAPVPEEYAKPYDSKASSDYGANFASTGPYQIERDASGKKVIGYEATKKIIMVRNKSWNGATDTIRKGFPDRIEVIEGFEDTGVATDKILSGEFDYNGDFTLPPEKIEGILGNVDQKSRVFFNANNCFRYVALNTTLKPFDNVKLRQAVAYVLNKNGMRLTRGGKRVGDIATHTLIPGINGYQESGGKTYDPYPSNNFEGDLTRAQELMREAGYPSGKYDGPPVYMVGGSSGVAPKTADVVQASLEKLGIKVRREQYKGNIMYTKYASVPAQKVQVLPNVGWCWDYPDSYTVIGALYDGRKITATGNNNYGQINDSELNTLIDEGYKATGTKRAALWAKANKRVMDLVPVIPWLWDAAPNLISKKVLNYTFTLSSSSMDLAVVALRPDVK